MSVAAGMAQPRSGGRRTITAAKIAAVTKPPNAAITGSAAFFGLASAPSIASRLISSPTSRKTPPSGPH